MTFWAMVIKEIGGRPLSFALAVLAAFLAAAAVLTGVISLRSFDGQTRGLLAKAQERLAADMAAMEDDVRKITLGLGFNVLILPQDQPLADVYIPEGPPRTMPEEFGRKLAAARVQTVQHLLPVLQQRLAWPEKNRTIILVGTSGELPSGGDGKKPLLAAVKPGQAVLGYELGKPLGLAAGQKVALLGREFTVAAVNGQRGTADDVTIWIDLSAAQELLNQPGRISAIKALSCTCVGDRLEGIRKEVSAVLPQTQVIEFAGQAAARDASRARAAEESRTQVDRLAENRAALRQQQNRLYDWLIPAVVLAAGLWMAVLSLGNARQRAGEVGLLRALGMNWRRIALLLLSRAGLGGLAGAVVAAAVAWPVGLSAGCERVFLLQWTAAALAAGPVLAMLAAWLPTLWAVRQDVSAVLE